MDLDKGNLPSMKTLGVLWLAKEDVFTYRVNPPDEKFQLTKRNFLRKIAMLFDPMGFLAQYVIRAKILLQEMWTSGLDWDDPLDYPGPRGFLLFFIGKFCDANRFLNFFYWYEALRAEKRKPLVATVGNLTFMPPAFDRRF